MSTPIAIFAALAALLVSSVAPPLSLTPAAAAVAPPTLVFANQGQSVASVVSGAQSTLSDGDSQQIAQRGAVTSGWYYHIDDVGGEQETAVISPEISVFDWAADQSGSMTVYAGEPYWADLSQAPIPSEIADEGTVLWEMQYATGEAQQPEVDLPDATTTTMLGLLRAYGMTNATDGYDLLHTVDLVQQAWTLTNAHHSALLTLISEAKGVSVLGTGTDRAGRAISALSVDMPGGKSELHMFVSRETGRIIGVEVLMTAATSQFPTDAIISYSMWDLPLAPKHREENE